MNADPDPATQINADPDPATQINVDPDPKPCVEIITWVPQFGEFKKNIWSGQRGVLLSGDKFQINQSVAKHLIFETKC